MTSYDKKNEKRITKQDAVTANWRSLGDACAKKNVVLASKSLNAICET